MSESKFFNEKSNTSMEVRGIILEIKIWNLITIPIEEKTNR